MTHADLVKLSYRWVLRYASCGVAFKELTCYNDTGEIADVIGFGAWGHSVLVECKVGRADFLRDKKKPFRIHPELGMGGQRFYCCPAGLIQQNELPEGWGLLWVNEQRKIECIFSPYQGNIQIRTQTLPKNIKAEMAVMYSALKRVDLSTLKSCEEVGEISLEQSTTN